MQGLLIHVCCERVIDQRLPNKTPIKRGDILVWSVGLLLLYQQNSVKVSGLEHYGEHSVSISIIILKTFLNDVIVNIYTQ